MLQQQVHEVSRSSKNGDEVPEATPSKLGRIFGRIHDSGQTRRAIADTAKGRRIKAQQRKDERKGKGK